MTQNNNLSVLPFYTSLDEQSHRRSYAYGEIYPLYTPTVQIPPFQIIGSTLGNVTQITLCKPDGSMVRDLTSSMTVKKFSMNGYDVLAYAGLTTIASLSEGQYYLVISDGSHTFYSDVFTMVAQISPYLMIEWWDEYDMLSDGWGIVYEYASGTKFKNRLYLNTQLGKPDYVFEEEGQQRDGYFFPEKQISEKSYKCTILAPEYLCDVMRFIRMSDHIRIVDCYGHEYLPDTFLITPKWETQGDLASVEIEFQTGTVAKKIARGM